MSTDLDTHSTADSVSEPEIDRLCRRYDTLVDHYEYLGETGCSTYAVSRELHRIEAHLRALRHARQETIR